MKTDRSFEEREPAWRTISYEIETFSKLPVAAAHLSVIQNALTESQVLHARQICGILLDDPPKRRPDEILLCELIDGFTSPNLDALRKFYTSEFADGLSPREILNKRCMHASYIRTDSHNYGAILLQLRNLSEPVLEDIRAARPGT